MAARGAKIVISAQQNGKFQEGYIEGTPKPGVCLEVKTFFYQEGKHLYRVFQPGADGDRRPVIVLLEDDLQGKTIDDAYATLTRCFVYYPQMGDELNMLFQNQSGTTDDHAAGEVLMIDNSTGLLIATTGTPESEPFINMVAVTDPAADFLNPCLYTGH